MTSRRDRLTAGSTPTHRPLVGTVSATYLSGIWQFAVSCGADAQRLLSAIALSEGDLADPDRRLPLDAARALFAAAAHELQAPAFALTFGVGVPCTTLTLAAALAAAQPDEAATAPTPGAGRTLRDALDGLNRYASLGIDFGAHAPAQRFRFVEGAPGVWLEDCRPDHAHGYDWPALTESVFARFATGIRRRGGEAIVRALDVSHAPPTNAAHRAAYDAVFRAPVTFGAARNAICLDPAFLEQPLEPLPRPVQTVLTRHADAQLQRVHEASSRRSWQHQVDVLLRAHPGADIQTVCRALAMSRHTLHRRLRDEGTTFAAVQAAARQRLARAMLVEGGLPVTVVAARLGFSEPGAFSRAYKRWTGMPPSAAREHEPNPTRLTMPVRPTPPRASPDSGTRATSSAR